MKYTILPANWMFSSRATAAAFKSHAIRYVPLDRLDMRTTDVRVLSDKIKQLSKAFADLERNLNKCKK